MNLTDELAYNMAYAPNYPDEDRTSLEKEYNSLVAYVNNILMKTNTEYKIKQFTFAKTKIDEAFMLYKLGKDGRKLLEEALEYIERSKRKKDGPINFIAGEDGIVIIHTEQKL